MKMYSIYDKKMGSYMVPMFVKHIVEIQRNMIQVMSNEKSLVAQFPTDFEVYLLGEFNDKTGELTLKSKPEFQFNASDLTETEKAT